MIERSNRKLRNAVLLGVLLASIAGTPVVGQDYDGSTGYGVGAIWFSDFNAGGAGTPFGLDGGWVLSTHVEQWHGAGRFGTRLNGAFTRRPLPTLDATRNIQSWVLGGDLLARFAAPDPARQVAPFVAAGVGLVRYALGEGPPVVLAGEEARYPGNPASRLTVSAGLGVDIMPEWTISGTPVGIRAEVLDHIALRSPFAPLDGGRFGPVHNVRLSLGLIGLFDHLFR